MLTLNNNHTARGARAKGDLVLPISCRCLGELALLPGISRRRLGDLVPPLGGADAAGAGGARGCPALGDSGGPSTAAVAGSQTPPQGAWGLASAQVPSRHGTRPWRIERSGSMLTPCPCRCRLSVRSSEVPRHHGPEKERQGEAMRREREPRLSLSQGRLMVAALPALGRAPPPAAEI